DSVLIKMPQLGDFIDEGSIHGVFNRVITRPLKKAQHWFDDNVTVMSREWAKLAPKNKAEARRLESKINNTLLMGQDGKPRELTINNLRMIMLNMGNESNKRVLLQGHNWKESDVQALIDQYATPEDHAFVRGIWDSLKPLWPHIQAVRKQMTGIAPQKVKGDYFPLISDRTLDKVDVTKGPFERMFVDPFADARAFHDRTGKAYPLDLDFNLLPSRVIETIHGIAFQIPVREAWKLIDSDVMRKGVTEKFGKEYYDMFLPWLQYVANNGALRDSNVPATINRWLAQTRLNSVVFLVGTRPSTTLIHSLSALSNSIGETNRVDFLRASRDLSFGGDHS
ncbi:MAG: hypothetical protein L0287_15235, partial [Anaerolineae bacterium]|nr:hypothetical protein [Anaerolineae bacterium]